jgi:hypothetical protein
VSTGAAPASYARRVDGQSGVVEDAGFYGTPGNRVFGVSYRPAGSAAAGSAAAGEPVLICPPLLSEFDQSYSVCVSLGRELARRGVPAFSFHYRGTGHSDGEAADLSLETMREDMATTAERIAGETGRRDPVVVATRLSAIAAASAPAEIGAQRLVLWEPALNGRRYFREAWRADMMFQINEGASTQERETFAAQLERTGQVDVLGYPIGRALHDSFATRTLAGELARAPAAMLIVRGGPPEQTRSDLDELRDTLGARGCPTEIQALEEPIVWWFQGPEMRRNSLPHMARMVEITVDWVTRETSE